MATGGAANPLASTLIGRSAVMCQLRARIECVAPAPISVLIEGPTGAGKELVAEALHARSGRVGPFVPFNVSATADSMADDTLFGHVKGAFTGATNTQLGVLAQADRGTLFLDEISTLAIHLQPKLLRALESHVFRPIGSGRDVRSDFRLVAASNEELDTLVQARRFRVDLMHRLDGILLSVPPLAARREDIEELARHFLAEHHHGDPRRTLTAQAVHVLQTHDWPGNVRELRQVISRACLLADAHVIGADDIAAALQQRPAAIDSRLAVRAVDDDAVLGRRFLAALDASDGDVAAAGARLGMSRATAYRRLKQLGVAPPRRRPHGGVPAGPSSVGRLTDLTNLTKSQRP